MSLLGMTVRDRVSGFEGMAVARVEYLWGCVKYSVQPCGMKKDGGVKDELWMDEDRLIIVPKGKKYGAVKKVAITGASGDPHTSYKL